MDSLFDNQIEKQFERRTKEGVVSAQDLDSYQIIEAVMRKGLKEDKIWWFAYELMGFHIIDDKRYFLSYKASTRVSEMAKDSLVESRRTIGKLNLYRLLI